MLDLREANLMMVGRSVQETVRQACAFRICHLIPR